MNHNKIQQENRAELIDQNQENPALWDDLNRKGKQCHEPFLPVKTTPDECRFTINNQQQIRATLLICVFCKISTSGCYILFAPFLPLEMDKKGYDISSIGIILSSFAIAFGLSGFFLPMCLKVLKKRTLLQCCLNGIALTTATFGFLITFGLSDFWFVAFAIGLRVLTGFFNGLTFSLWSSIILKNFPPESRSYAIAANSMSSGLGIVLGQLYGGFFYRLFGFQAPILINSGLILLSTPLIYWFVPSVVDETQEETEGKSERESTITKVGTLLKVPAISAAYFAFFMSWIFFVYFEPLLAMRMKDHYEVSLFWNNMMFTIQPISFVLASLFYLVLTGKFGIIPHYFRTLIVAQFMMSICLLLGGPSNFLPDNIFLLTAGLFGNGFFSVLIQVPAIALAQAKAVEVYGEVKAGSLADTQAILITITYSLGSALAPLVGTYGESLFGFRGISDILAGVSFLNFGIYLLLNRGHRKA